MTKSEDLLNITDLCNYFGLSESTIRRKVRDSRDGQGTFPLPLFRSGCRVLWKKSDIESWNGEDGEVIRYTASPTLPAIQPKTSAQVRKGLEALGVKLPPTGNELNN